MLNLLIFSAAASLNPSPHDVCHGNPVSPPVGQFGHYVPGFGRVTGLNDDFHDDIEDPGDVPGSVISVVARDGGIQLLPANVGADCPIELED